MQKVIGLAGHIDHGKTALVKECIESLAQRELAHLVMSGDRVLAAELLG